MATKGEEKWYRIPYPYPGFEKKGEPHRLAAGETHKITGTRDWGILLCGVNGWRGNGTHIVV